MIKSNEQLNYQLQKIVVFVAFFLFGIKIFAWFITDSVAIYSDALESIVNMISSLLGLYSLYLTTQPQDENHPYGHGKVEFISAAIEGLLICLAGIIILIEAVQNLFNQHAIHQMDNGILLILATAIINMIIGLYAIKKGKTHKSLVLQSTGKHLLSDTYSTLGIVIGLTIIYFTNLLWMDSVIGIITSLIILYTGYKIVRTSVSGIMDEADEKLINEIIIFLENNRKPTWIDIHNLRVIKYGPKLHVDVHLTLPYYLTVNEAHDEMEQINYLLNEYFGDKVEVFIHADPCQDFSCKICMISDCPVRKAGFEQKLNWNYQNVAPNTKHQLPA